MTVYRSRTDGTRTRFPSNPRVREGGVKLPDNLLAILEDSDRRVWLSSLGGVFLFDSGRVTAVPSIPPGFIVAIAEERPGSVWITHRQRGLVHWINGQVVEEVPWENLGHKDEAQVLLPDPARGGVWLGFLRGGVAFFKNGRVEESYGPGNG